MSRLRNRMVKAEFWTDPDLLSWPRDKRFFYVGLRALAEDSGCIEDSPFAWTCVLYSSPQDRDITVEMVTAWRDEMIADGKLVRYTVDGKDYLFQTTFHKHETPRNPQAPTIPLPPWVHVETPEGTASDGKRWSRTQYRVDENIGTDSVRTPYCVSTGSPALPCPVKKNSLSQKVLATPDEDWKARAEAVLEQTRFRRQYEDLADLMAADNKTGKVSLRRVVTTLYDPLLAFENNGTSPAAFEYGLLAAIGKGAANANYVKQAARGYNGQRMPSRTVSDGVTATPKPTAPPAPGMKYACHIHPISGVQVWEQVPA